MYYNIERVEIRPGVDLFKVGFGPESAQNDRIVQEAVSLLEGLKPQGGKLALVNGPASLPVACVLAHALGHLYGALGVFDPKVGRYLICVSHDPTYPVGSWIDE